MNLLIVETQELAKSIEHLFMGFKVRGKYCRFQGEGFDNIIIACSIEHDENNSLKWFDQHWLDHFIEPRLKKQGKLVIL